METSTLQERRKFNEEIERAFIDAARYLRVFLRFRQSDRGIALIDIYEEFFDAFSLLVILTSDLAQLRDSQNDVKKASDWVLFDALSVKTDKEIDQRFKEGMDAFLCYKKLLSEQGVISLPNK